MKARCCAARAVEAAALALPLLVMAVLLVPILGRAGDGACTRGSHVMRTNLVAGESYACCVPSGACVEVMGDEFTAQEDCDALNGVFDPSGGGCVDVICTPRGGCCFEFSGCLLLTEDECLSGSEEGTYLGDGVLCDEGVCDGACCFGDGSCEITSAINCDKSSGAPEFLGPGTSCTACAPDRVDATQKGSMLAFSAIDLQWGGTAGPAVTLSTDCFVSITNDYPADVRVQMYYINGDPPLPADPVTGERAHPGWNKVDNLITLTGDQTTYWSVLTGLPAAGGIAPFTVLDPGFPPGRPGPNGSRVLRGYLVAWAVDADGEEIRWNHLQGNTTCVDYLRGAAFEANAWAYRALDPAVPNGGKTGTPGTLFLNGVEFSNSFDQLLLNFQAVPGSAFSGPRQVVSDTWLTLHPAGVDLRQETDGPITTKANADVWNMNEVKFSEAHRCITCWDQVALSAFGNPNHFLLQHLQTAHGKARFKGLASQVCDVDVDPTDGPLGAHPDDVISTDAPLLGFAVRRLTIDGGADHAYAGSHLVGMGLDPTATIKYDVLGLPPEAGMPESPAEILEWLEGQAHREWSAR